MKNFIQENGILKTFIFVLALLIPLSIVAIYMYATIDWPYFEGWKSPRIYSFLLLCWIFFGVKSKDFFGEGKENVLKPKHIMMMTMFFTLNLTDNVSFYNIVLGLGIIGIIIMFDSNNAGQGMYWQAKISTKNYSKEDIINAIKKEFFVIRTGDINNTFLIKGYGLWFFQTKVFIEDSDLYIQIKPMNAGLTFIMAFKVMPVNIGKYYGERVLKNLGIALDDLKKSKTPLPKYEA